MAKAEKQQPVAVIPTKPGKLVKTSGGVGALMDAYTSVQDLHTRLSGRGSIKHAGGALPSLFPENLEIGDARFVRFERADVVPAERSGTGNDFTVLTFAAIDPSTMEEICKAQMPLSTVMEDYFKCEAVSRTVTNENGEQVKLTSKVVTRTAEETPLLIITYMGEYESKRKGFNAAKKWVIEEWRAAE